LTPRPRQGHVKALPMRPPVIAASAPGISSIGARSPWWSGVLRTRLHLVHQWAHAFSASDCKNDQPGQGARHLQTASCTDQSGHSGPSERRSGYSNQLAYDPSPPASHETVVRSSETASLATGGKEPACMCMLILCHAGFHSRSLTDNAICGRDRQSCIRSDRA